MNEILKVENLTKAFRKKDSTVISVDNISFNLYKGEILGIVGESGSGKSTLARLICRLADSDTGRILYKNTDISKLSKKNIKEYRKSVQMVFQDPYSSLNPRMTVFEIMADPLKNLTNLSNDEIEKRVFSTALKCGLQIEQLKRFPHEFSGGQRQRIGIARALIVEPEILIADEPTSALDVSIQAQIINLIAKLKNEMNLSSVFISHDLSVIEHISDRIIVMNKGKIVEMGKREDIFKNPVHPYTIKLLNSIPEIKYNFDDKFYKNNFKNTEENLVEISSGHYVLN